MDEGTEPYLALWCVMHPSGAIFESSIATTPKQALQPFFNWMARGNVEGSFEAMGYRLVQFQGRPVLVRDVLGDDENEQETDPGSADGPAPDAAGVEG